MTGARETFSAAFAPDARLRRLTKGLATPFLLYDEKSLTDRAQALLSAFSWNDGFRQYVPVRDCAHQAILERFLRAGFGAMCTDLAQLKLASSAGFSGEKLLFSPLAPDAAAFDLAMALDAVWAVDGAYVLPPRAPKRVLLSYHPTGKLISDGKTLVNFSRVKYGMEKTELIDMARRFRAFGSESIGLILFARENCLEQAYYPAVAQALFRLAAELKQTADITIDACNLAGGFGVSDSPAFASPDLALASSQIRALHEQMLSPCGLSSMHLQTALSRFLLTGSAALVTQVIAVRERDMPVLFVDAAFSPAARLPYHRIDALDPRAKRDLKLYCLVGCEQTLLCAFDAHCVLPLQKPGCRLLIHMAGADAGVQNAASYLLRADGTIVPL